MADPEHVELVQEGAAAIQAWRDRNDPARLDLNAADLAHADLANAYLADADLTNADLAGADLGGADLTNADLAGADLAEAYLAGAHFAGATLTGADLTDADLSGADLTGADLFDVKLPGADLASAKLSGANLSGVDLTGANLAQTTFAGAICDATVFVRVDLSEVAGIATLRHLGPSSIGVDTLATAKGRLPDVFLRGCGLSDWEILAAKLYTPGLDREEITRILYDIIEIRAGSPVQISPLFISYAHEDAAYVDHLAAALNAKSIRFWRDIHDMTAGPVEQQLERAITLNPTFILVLSKHSASSDWVEWETGKARKLEQELARQGRARHVLCPVALDDAWKMSAWPGPLRNQIAKYHVLDFSRWQTADIFKRQFGKLIDGLGLFYGDGGEGQR